MKNLASGIIISILSITLNAQTFTTAEDSRNQATFESNAPLEDIVGVSDKLSASATINLSDLSTASGKVEVDLREMKTGINLRDEHLRSPMWLNTSEFPFATFELKKITGVASLTEGVPAKVKFNGTFTVHGVSKDIVADGEITYFAESEKTKVRIKGNLLKIEANFNIKLEDYGITIPSIVAGKVDDNIKVSATFVASDSK
jgi:polyisoprenoid-binding protein YceI